MPRLSIVLLLAACLAAGPGIARAGASGTCGLLAPCLPSHLPGITTPSVPSGLGPAFKTYESPEQLRQDVQKFFQKFASKTVPSIDGIVMPVPVGADATLDATTLYKRSAPSVLYVVAQSAKYTMQGSAVAISPSVAMTDCHVVMSGDGDPEKAATVFTQDMPQIAVEDSSGDQGSATVLVRHPDIDICLIRVSGMVLTPVPGIVPFSAVEIGEPVYTLGNPEGLSLTLAQGIVSQLRDDVPLPHHICADVIQHSAPMSQGSSGGALFDSAGRLIGITQGLVPSGENLNIAIPASLLWDMYSDNIPPILTVSCN